MTLRRRAVLAASGAAAWAPSWARAAEGPMWRPWPKDKPAPPVDLPQLDGRRWRLADQAGKPVLLNFWASWCGPCRAEMPSLALLATRRKAEGLVVVAVNFKENPATARRFLDEVLWDEPALLDADGAATRAFGIIVFPASVLVDRRGRVLGMLLGELDWGSPAADRHLAPILAPS